MIVHSPIFFGIDWSGAKNAGKKIWRAEVDSAAGGFVRVERPWPDMTREDVIPAVRTWLLSLHGGWVGMDFCFGIASADQQELFETAFDDPRAWSQACCRRFRYPELFIEQVREKGLLGQRRRMTDSDAGVPYPPLFMQIIYQTYAGMSLLQSLPREGVNILPWDRDNDGESVSLVEICPSTVLKSLELPNRGYKGIDPLCTLARRTLLRCVLQLCDLTCSRWTETIVTDDPEGDALDAILAAIGAMHASSADHPSIAAIAGRLAEGHIYC